MFNMGNGCCLLFGSSHEIAFIWKSRAIKTQEQTPGVKVWLFWRLFLPEGLLYYGCFKMHGGQGRQEGVMKWQRWRGGLNGLGLPIWFTAGRRFFIFHFLYCGRFCNPDTEWSLVYIIEYDSHTLWFDRYFSPQSFHKGGFLSLDMIDCRLKWN